MFRLIWSSVVIIASFGFSSAQATEHRYYDQGSLSLTEVQKARAITRRNGKPIVNEIRAEALKETALMYGSRAGLYARMRVINGILDRRAVAFDQVFPFAQLMLAQNVCPPVVQVGYDNVRVPDGDRQTMRLADAIYDIVSNPQFAQTPPDWRTYLYLSADKPEPPDESLLPDAGKPAEVALWQDYVERGWRAGVEQADRTFEVKLNQLVRDLTGMALYRELLAKEMISPPRVSEEFLGVTGSRKRMSVNDRILTIQALPSFVHKNQKWKPYVNKASKRRKEAPAIDIHIHAEPQEPPKKTQPTLTRATPKGWDSR